MKGFESKSLIFFFFLVKKGKRKNQGLGNESWVTLNGTLIYFSNSTECFAYTVLCLDSLPQ